MTPAGPGRMHGVRAPRQRPGRRNTTEAPLRFGLPEAMGRRTTTMRKSLTALAILAAAAVAGCADTGARTGRAQSSTPAALPMQIGQRVQLGTMGDRVVREVMVSQGGGGLIVVYDMPPGQPEFEAGAAPGERQRHAGAGLRHGNAEHDGARLRWRAAPRPGRRRHVFRRIRAIRRRSARPRPRPVSFLRGALRGAAHVRRRVLQRVGRGGFTE